jgi:hypothetical protein
MKWTASYYGGGSVIRTLEIQEEDAFRAKSIAYHSAPEGSDMIKLLSPDGKTLVRTSRKHWIRVS